MTNNPLTPYFRKPAIHLELPSGGRFYATGSLDMPVTNEVEVYPMTALDDITYKTPDALFNGSAIISVIKSCIPAIVDPWEMPTIDLNIILTAIRIASVGHDMEISSMCPACKEVTDYDIDLRVLIDKSPDVSLYDTSLQLGDIEIFFKPLTYKQVNDSNKIQFKEEKLHQVLKDSEVSTEDKMKLLSDAFREIADFSVNSMAASVAYIKTPDTMVDDNAFIKDFLSNCTSKQYELIKKRLFELKDIEELDDVHIECTNEECKHEYNQGFTLDMTSFFDHNS